VRLQTAVHFIVAAVLISAAALGAQGQSKWVYPDAKGRLQYTADARGNRIMDFSHAGYKGGGVRSLGVDPGGAAPRRCVLLYRSSIMLMPT
jgi:hypothetical protein